MIHEMTHQRGRQIVSPRRLREILQAAGESCYCAPDESLEWDVAGDCPEHPSSQADGADDMPAPECSRDE